MNWKVSSRGSGWVNRDYIVGKHVFGSLYGIPPEVAEDEELVRQAVLDAVRAANATLIQIMSWKIPGHKGGVSVIALVNESHIGAHAWGGTRCASVDVYTGGDNTNPDAASRAIADRLRPEYYTYNYADRTQFPASSPIAKEEQAVAAR